jgi:hypothetical protein
MDGNSLILIDAVVLVWVIRRQQDSLLAMRVCMPATPEGRDEDYGRVLRVVGQTHVLAILIDSVKRAFIRVFVELHLLQFALPIDLTIASH